MVEMDYWFIAYILISIVLGLASVSYLYKRGQTIGAMLSMVLLTAIFVFYGLRWFSGGSLKGTTGTGQAWPPIVNLCPDFMSSVKISNGNNYTIYCVDTNDLYGLKTKTAVANYIDTGVTVNNTNYSGLIIVRSDKNTTAKTLTQDTGAGIPERRWPVLSQMKSNLGSVFSSVPELRTARWEGVYDGISATPDKLPLPGVL